MHKTAVLDVDGVILDMTPVLSTWCLEKYGKLISEEFITSWDWDYCLGIDFDSEVWNHIWNTPMPLFDGADRLIEALRKAGYKIVLLSCRPEVWSGLDNEAAAREAAIRDFKKIDHDEAILVNHGKEKAEMVNWLTERDGKTPDFVVEDHPINAKTIGDNTPVDTYLLTRPWNRECISLTDSWKRVVSYGDLLRRVA
jgi:phosphoglycolate phosphatase-like HAD superfamily hydrolase